MALSVEQDESRAILWERCREVLQELQKTLLPEHADKIIALDAESGAYHLGKTSREAVDGFLQQYPDRIPCVVRVDGGPVYKFRTPRKFRVLAPELS